jgi:hypothetical protein
MPEMSICDAMINYEEREHRIKITRVLINHEDIQHVIIQGLRFVNFHFNDLRPDEVQVTFPNRIKELAKSIFYAADELYNSNRGCLAAYLTTYFFDSFTGYWRYNLLKQGKHIVAIQLWLEIISWATDWEESTGNHLHKGSPYAFLAYTYLMIGDIDTGFAYIYNAIEDDIVLNSVCPRVNYPYNAPVYLTATLSSRVDNVMSPLVAERRNELLHYLDLYRKELHRDLSLDDIDRKFLQNPILETIKYYFIFTFWTIYEHQRKIRSNLMNNDFARLRYSDWLFALCLVIDKLLNSHPSYNARFIGTEIVRFVTQKGWMTKVELNSLKERENIQGGDPDEVSHKLLTTNIDYNGTPVRTEIRNLLIAWNLRNFSGHNIQTQRVIGTHFQELLKILLFDIFLILEEY